MSISLSLLRSLQFLSCSDPIDHNPPIRRLDFYVCEPERWTSLIKTLTHEINEVIGLN